MLAIAAGIVSGRRLGASGGGNGGAGLCRADAFGRAYGAKAETITGLSGLGDLILTTSGPQSRNFAFGQALGAGTATGDKLAEGAFTTSVLVEMARAKGVDARRARRWTECCRAASPSTAPSRPSWPGPSAEG